MSDEDANLNDLYCEEAIKEYMEMWRASTTTSYFLGLPWGQMERLFPELRGFIDERLEHILSRIPRDRNLHNVAHQAAAQGCGPLPDASSSMEVCLCVVTLLLRSHKMCVHLILQNAASFHYTKLFVLSFHDHVRLTHQDIMYVFLGLGRGV
jgi:hypothetical protein